MLWLDTETYCELPISHGTYAYAERCEVDIITYAHDDGPVTVVDAANGPRGDISAFRDAAHEAEIVVAHNAMFDRTVLRLGNLGIGIPIAKWRCSMVRALAHGLPGSLDKLCDILDVPEASRKLREGHALMMLFCKPRPKNSRIRRATKATHPAEWERYLRYAELDIIAMREINRRLPSWNYSLEPPGGDRPRDREVALWHLDQKINDRGYAVDLPLVDAALRAVDAEHKRLKQQTQKATRYDPELGAGLESTTRRDAMLGYLLEDHGVFLPDLKSSTVERVLEDETLEPVVRQLLELRLEATTTSTSKYKAIKRAASPDGRVRGTIQFDGAARTRRAAGRTVQPQNFPSRNLIDPELIELGIQALMDESEDLIFPSVMQLTSSVLRPTIVAPRGRKLVVADESNIEGRGLAWLAGEQWKLQAFRDFDAGTGHDLYKLAYAKLFGGRPEDVSKAQRQIGKVDELACGYQGALGAFVTFALAYGMDLDQMADDAWENIPEEARREAKGLYDWMVGKKIDTYGLREKTAVTILCFVTGWRESHPAVIRMWRGLEEGFKEATDSPGRTIEAGRFRLRRDGAWLRIILPSGRALCYPRPRVDGGKASYMGVNQFNRRWTRIDTYGGRLAENATQSFARDILYDAMPRAEERGYRIVLHVHDELVTEVPDTEDFNVDELGAILATPPDYALDMPLAATGFEAYRYGKG